MPLAEHVTNFVFRFLHKSTPFCCEFFFIFYILCIVLGDRSLFIGGGGGGGFRGILKFWPLNKGGPGVIAELWRGALKF